MTDETRATATRAVAAVGEVAQAALESGRALGPEVVASLESVVAQILHDVRQSGEVALALGDLGAADGYTLQHSVNVAALGLLLGDRLFRERGYRNYRGRRSWERVDQRLTRLGLGLLVHDIGKLAVPREILTKPGRLDPDEWELMRGHPLAGLELLRSDLISPLVKTVVRSHHERWDGAGYPDGKAEDEIHEFARIAAVADVYDAVTSQRVYAAAKPAHVGVSIVRDGSGSAFDPEVVEVFERIVAPYPPGIEVRLSDGRWAIVADVPPYALDCPVVRVTHDADGFPIEARDIRLAETPGLWVDDRAASRSESGAVA
jgi:HD-GYP domain-containing protein (c-di-GMP phosphodiesterase class II)